MSKQARFEVLPEKRAEVDTSLPLSYPGLTGLYRWHFRDADGRITFTGGGAFTRREDAHRSIRRAAANVARLLGVAVSTSPPSPVLPIVDLNENGHVIAPAGAALDDELARGKRKIYGTSTP
jgi:hypothetical protein